MPTPIYTTRNHLTLRADDLAAQKVSSLEDVRALGIDNVVLAMFSTAPADFLRNQHL